MQGMKQISLLFISLAVALCFSSCSDSRDSLMQDQVGYINGMAEVLEEVADGSMSSADAADKFADYKKEGDDIMKRKEELMKDLSVEEGKALMEKYSKEITETFKRYMNAVQSLEKSGRATQELLDAVSNLK